MFFSQYKQDEYLHNNVFKGFKNGIFMDVGAHNGIAINNTLYFQKNHNWSGINIEPIKKVYDDLIKNRPLDINLNCAISDKNGTANFLCNSGYTEMLSGLTDNYDPRHINRINLEIDKMGGKSENITVETKRIDTICKDHKITHIHYLTIDVEGAEFSVIKSINFNDVFIDIIQFENNYKDTALEIIKFLENKNFQVIKFAEDVFMINIKSQFRK